MIEAFKALLQQPYWVISLILGSVLVGGPCVTISKDNHFATHAPTTQTPVGVGIGLLALSALAFGVTLWQKQRTEELSDAGLDLRRVEDKKGVIWTTVNGCEVRVIYGCIEDCEADAGTVIVLPCSEYFDDECAGDTKSALGAYVNRVFDGQVSSFASLVRAECFKNFGQGVRVRKTDREDGDSFGAGGMSISSMEFMPFLMGQ